MALFHFSVKICSRGQGKSSIIANCAYIHGDRIKSEYDGKVYDFTRKQDVVYEGILLPPGIANIERYQDYKILWNEVEMVEKGKRAQLARTIEAAIPRELPLQKQIELVEEFLQPFAKQGMCVDYVIHEKEPGKPHLHAILTIRPLNPDGSWGVKQRKVYDLDKNGKKIYDSKKRQYKCHTLKTTDWERKENVEKWRAEWAKECNKHLISIGSDARVDHKSYHRQGIDKIPKKSYSKEALALERKGITTSISDLNAIISHANYLTNSLFSLMQNNCETEEERLRRRL